MTKQNKKSDLEDRLINFAVRIIQIAESLPKTKAGNHFAGQLIRCGTAPAPNYGEAQDAEYRADFIHKMKILLVQSCRLNQNVSVQATSLNQHKLRETRIWLLIIGKAGLINPTSKLGPLIDESNQLISIFVTSVKTAKQNKNKTS